MGLVLCPWLVRPVLAAIPGRHSIAGVVLSRQSPGFHGAKSLVENTFRQTCLTVTPGDLSAVLVQWLKATEPEVVFVTTFPHRIPPAALAIPPRGFLNFHPGQLPAFRGPDPLFWQIRLGAGYGGVVVHQMTPELDAGPMVGRYLIPLGGDENYGHHAERLPAVFQRAVIATLKQLQRDELAFEPQEESRARYFKAVRHRDLIIHWDDDPRTIAALVRAASPNYGGALLYWRDQSYGLLRCRLEPSSPGGGVAAGTVLDGGGALWVQGRQDTRLVLEQLVLDGRRVTGGEFKAALQLHPGERLPTSVDGPSPPSPWRDTGSTTSALF